MSNLKAYAVGDSDVYAAHTAEQAVNLANDMHGIEDDPAFSIDDVIVLSDADLDKEYPEFDDNEVATGGMTTIRHWLNEMNDPGWLCGSDW